MSDKKFNFFSKIESKEDCLKAIKEYSNAFFFVAILQGVLGYFLLGLSVLFDVFIYVFFAFLMRKFNSRISAVILFLFSLLGLYATFLNKVNNSNFGGRNLILAVLIVFAGIKSIQATFKYHKLKNQVG